jgi:hypothetical protein
MRMIRPEHLSPSLDVRESREFASEIKFCVPSELGVEIRGWARQWLAPDPYAGGEMGDTYRTASLYFDTAGFEVLRRAGSFGRSKYRIRRYGDSQGVFLERKLKTRNMVSKRRSVIGMEDLERLESSPQRGWTGHWFHRRIAARLLQPVCQISYHRTARVGSGSYGAIRLTIDQEVCALPAGRLAFHSGDPGTPLTDGHMIVELKFRRTVPPQFAQLIENFRLEPQPVSKYRLAAAIDGCVAGWYGSDAVESAA